MKIILISIFLEIFKFFIDGAIQLLRSILIFWSGILGYGQSWIVRDAKLHGRFNALFSRILLAFVKCRSDGFSFKCRFDIWGEKYSRVGFPFEDYFRVRRLELFFLFKWLFGQFYSFFHERKFCWAMLKVNHRNLLCLKIVCCLCCLICTIITVYYVLALDS